MQSASIAVACGASEAKRGVCGRNLFDVLRLALKLEGRSSLLFSRPFAAVGLMSWRDICDAGQSEWTAREPTLHFPPLV